MTQTADHRLATYGSLRPGKSNHHQLAGLEGHWIAGSVMGHLFQSGWGAAHGFPGLVLDAQGQSVEVEVFLSEDLPDHWPRLDAFEGADYQRVVTQVLTSEGPVDACIYVIASPRETR